jgi:riboflavin synthase
LTKTILGRAKIGDRVNLERALRLSDRLDGHLVSGHVDGIGIVAKRKIAGNSIIITVRVQESLSRYIINKGSVAIDGVSLTVNRCDGNSFDVTIIPHTAENTTINLYKNGDYVNIETDMIGKYVERFVLTKDKVDNRQEAGELSLDMQFLKKTGFL